MQRSGPGVRPLRCPGWQALSRGGRYTLDNIVPACRSCNAGKRNDEVTGWMRRKKLDERAFVLRNLEIRTALAGQSSAPDAAADSPRRRRRLAVTTLLRSVG